MLVRVSCSSFSIQIFLTNQAAYHVPCSFCWSPNFCATVNAPAHSSMNPTAFFASLYTGEWGGDRKSYHGLGPPIHWLLWSLGNIPTISQVDLISRSIGNPKRSQSKKFEIGKKDFWRKAKIAKVHSFRFKWHLPGWWQFWRNSRHFRHDSLYFHCFQIVVGWWIVYCIFSSMRLQIALYFVKRIVPSKTKKLQYSTLKFLIVCTGSSKTFWPYPKPNW